MHHSALPFKKLRSMKVTDRFSCSVILRQPAAALPTVLSRPEYFGQFGKIVSLRVLQESQPLEVFVRFSEEAAAVRAIAWCSSQSVLFSGAMHGYQKYCVDFLNGQMCRKRTCRNRHAWCDVPAVGPYARRRSTSDGQNGQNGHAQPRPLPMMANNFSACSSNSCSSRSNGTHSLSQTESVQPQPHPQQTGNVPLNQLNGQMGLHQTVLALRAQNGLQSSYIAQLLRTIEVLNMRNTVLATEVRDLQFVSVGGALGALELSDLTDLPEIVDDVLNEAEVPFSASIPSMSYQNSNHQSSHQHNSPQQSSA